MKICCKVTYLNLKDIEVGEVFKVSNCSEDYFIKARINCRYITVVNLITGVCSIMDEMKSVIKVNGAFIEDR